MLHGLEVSRDPRYQHTLDFLCCSDDLSSNRRLHTNVHTTTKLSCPDADAYGYFSQFHRRAYQDHEINNNVEAKFESTSCISEAKQSSKTIELFAESSVASGTDGHRRVSKPSDGCPRTSVPMLPPCRVCGEKASGFHYGANTCEACKGFFRRSLCRKESFQCYASNNCNILPGKRNVCASCRYKKCVSAGMSKNAIKTGRYTHEKKTRDIKEVKRLQRRQEIMEASSKMRHINSRGDSCLVMNEDDVDRIVEHIMNIHRIQTPHTKEFFDKLHQKEQNYLVCRELQHNVFGSLKPIAYQEYFKIYHITGIDVDGRKAMLEHMIPCIEKSVKRFVAFAKAIPGFKKLPIEDQIELIKGSRFEAWLVSTYRAFNPEHLIYTHFCGHTVHLEDMSTIYDSIFLHSVFKVAGMIRRLELSEDEECILKGIILLSPDRRPLQAGDQVEVNQMKMIEAMQCIHARRKPKDGGFFGRVVSVLIELRTLTELHTQQEIKINMEWATDFRMPPLLYDLFSV